MLWTEPMDLLADKLAAEHCSASVIARAIYHELGIGITRNAVIGRMFRRKQPLNGFCENYRSRPRKEKKKVPPRWAVNLPSFPGKEISELTPEHRGPTACCFLDLKPNSCRYSVGDPIEFFCGDPIVKGHSWCQRHCLVVYQQPRPTQTAESNQKRRAAQLRRIQTGKAESRFFTPSRRAAILASPPRAHSLDLNARDLGLFIPGDEASA
jgi:hypothetical protein